MTLDSVVEAQPLHSRASAQRAELIALVAYLGRGPKTLFLPKNEKVNI